MDLREKGYEDQIDEEVERELDQLSDDLTEDDRDRLREVVRERVHSEMRKEAEKLREERASELKKRAREERKKLEKREKEEEEYFIRLNRNFRFQHMVMFTACFLLIFTGLPLKFPDFFISQILMKIFGGIRGSTLIHRIGAILLIYFMVHHFFYCIFSRDGRRDFIKLIPVPKDVRDLVINVKHFIGKNPERPKFDRFSYIEKFDYWAVYWGCVIMIGTGLLLWFEEITMKYIPKYWVDIAKEAHSDEALLATLAIVIWHFYNVHFNPDRFPGSLMWWHGKISKHEMIEEHPLEYERMMREREEQEKSVEVETK
ncbi:MAG: cytochrome b/b6 domain-containing protein [Deltaproteobacteria bacterium]|nr:cytochrome b/b6 domain-containing protein [Deltaproteobacteria bacterium]NIS76340.1 cytochrome b/b6 domain-containing protein [Deltaproteobacteria bacterium]